MAGCFGPRKDEDGEEEKTSAELRHPGEGWLRVGSVSVKAYIEGHV